MAGLGRQAKVLSDPQVRSLIRHVEEETAYPERNRVVVLLSFKAGLRATEIAGLTWAMVTDVEGGLASAIALPNAASKGSSGRAIPLHADLRDALLAWQALEPPTSPADFVVRFKKGGRDPVERSNSVQFLFREWFGRLGYAGASSHSGRRTFITKAARRISQAGGSLRDVQRLAGHASLAQTQTYIDYDPEAAAKVVDLI